MIERLNFALDALKNITRQFTPSSLADSKARVDAHEAITDLRSVIAEMEAAEPVANVRTFTNGAGRREQRVVVIGDVNDGDLLYTHPQPKAEPEDGALLKQFLSSAKDAGITHLNIVQPKAESPKCVKCGYELMSSFTNTCYACNQKAK